MKAVIRIRLVECIDIVKSAAHSRIIRGNGADTWEAQLTIKSSEGHVTQFVFSSENKAQALQQAYECLRKHTIQQWFPAFYTEEAVKYADLLVREPAIADRFNESMSLVQQGIRTQEEHLTLWASRMDLLESTRFMLPLSPNREHVLPQDPPKKWKWYHWFWNPEGAKK